MPASSGVLTNDTDPNSSDVLKAKLASGPSTGKLTLQEDGSFVYKKPKKGFKKGATFVYEASDGKGGTDQAEVTISKAKKK